MKPKLILLLLTFFVSMAAMSQSFFKPLPKRSQQSVGIHPGGPIRAEAAATPSVMNAVRPILAFAGYSEPGHILMSGGGISYEHLLWQEADQKWKAQYSVSAIIFGGGGINAQEPDAPGAVTYGVLLGLQNNIINIGPTYNPGSKKIGIAVAIGLNLNN